MLSFEHMHQQAMQAVSNDDVPRNFNYKLLYHIKDVFEHSASYDFTSTRAKTSLVVYPHYAWYTDIYKLVDAARAMKAEIAEIGPNSMVRLQWE